MKGIKHTIVVYEPQVGPALMLWVDDATKLIDGVGVVVAGDFSTML